MTHPVPVRATKAVREVHLPDGTVVVESMEQVEFAAPPPPAPPALPPGPPTRVNTRADGEGMWMDRLPGSSREIPAIEARIAAIQAREQWWATVRHHAARAVVVGCAVTIVLLLLLAGWWPW